jgi:hypothetical protein
MRFWALLLLSVGAHAAAQPAPPQMPGWAPLAPYVTPGQDEPGYRNWYIASPAHAVSVKAFNSYLTQYGVGGVVPTWQLLRTASDWQKCGAAPFEVPPPEHWPNIVHALRFIGAFIEPVIGQVEVVSAYRNLPLNTCAHGAATSTHLTGGAIDMVPLSPTNREALMERLCRIQVDSGGWNGIGLGFYKGLRFHIDTRKSRDWGAAGKSGGWGCQAVLREGALPFVEPALPVAAPAAPQPLPRS